MKTLIVFSIALIVSAAVAQQSTPSANDNGVIYVPHDKVDAAFVKGGGIIPRTSGGVTVMAGRHDTPGSAEVHTLDTDIFYVTEGGATFITGGKVVDAKESGANEVRGKSIEGGTMHNLSKGDVIVIPKGVPHQFKEITGVPVLYFVVKVR
jgi:mannose-6-phosphate isomerase-like protein (cupin superfamily)